MNGGRELSGEGIEHSPVLAADGRAGEPEHVVRVKVDRGATRLGCLRNAVSTRGLDPPAAFVPMENRGSFESEHASESVEHAPRRSRSQRGGRAPPLPRARVPLPPPGGRRARRSCETIAPTARKTNSASTSSASCDRERVVGLDEEPVDEQEGAYRGRQTGREAADGGDHDDEEQEEEHHARQLELIPQRHEERGQQGQARDRSESAEHLATPGKRGGTARARDDERLLRAGVGVADDVDVDRRRLTRG